MPNLMNTRLRRSNRLGLGGCRDRVHRHVPSPLFARQGRRLPAKHSAVSCSFVERWTWLRILAVCQPHGLAPATTVRDHRTDAANISFAGAQLEQGSKSSTHSAKMQNAPFGAFRILAERVSADSLSHRDSDRRITQLHTTTYVRRSVPFHLMLSHPIASVMLVLLLVL